MDFITMFMNMSGMGGGFGGGFGGGMGGFGGPTMGGGFDFMSIFNNMFNTATPAQPPKKKDEKYLSDKYDEFMTTKYEDFKADKKPLFRFNQGKNIETDIKNVSDEYKTAAQEMGLSVIKSTSTDDNETISFNEFMAKEKADYKKQFGSEIETTEELTTLTKTTFDMMDKNKDGELDVKEMATVYAYQDLDGYKLDGKIRYADAFNFSQDATTADNMPKMYDKLWGTK